MMKLPFRKNKFAPDGASAAAQGFSAGELSRAEKKTGKKKLFTGWVSMILSIVLFTIGVLFFTAQSFGLRTWGGLTMDEMVFHLTAPKEGTESTILISAALQVFVPTGAALAGVIVLAAILRKKNIARYRAAVAAQFLAAAVLISYSVVHFLSETDGFDYIRSQYSDSAFIEENYTDPAGAVTFPEQKRNLIYIYLESMEATYTDKEHGGGFDEDYIPELTQLAEENEDFSGGSAQLNGGNVLSNTGYTMGGMFAQTSGLPLQTMLYNYMDTQTSFYSDIRTLGDLLNDQGYRQVLLLGSDASFGGRKLYFSEHGNYEMRDYNWAKETGRIPADYRAWWGYEDEKLFQYAKETLTELASCGRPFNLTMLTADTHFEDGYFCGQCQDQFHGNQYANVMACSSRQAAALVDWIRQQDFYENTTIVISGDHTTMDHDFCDSVPDDYTRKTYTCYINSAVQPADPGKRREYATIDNFPTTLAALGAQIDGDRLGLGTNLFSDRETLTEQYGLAKMNREMKNKSDFLAARNKIVLTDAMLASIQGYVQPVVTEDGRNLNVSLTGLDVVDRQSKIVTVSVLPVSEEGNEDAARSVQAVSEPIGDSTDQIYTAVIENAFSGRGTYLVRFRVMTEDGNGYSLEDVKIFYPGE
jgi:phosphoglycerol transferase